MHKLIKQLQETNPELNKFLVERRLRSKFLKNCINSSHFELSLLAGFYWNETPEGHTFWSNIGEEWFTLKGKY